MHRLQEMVRLCRMGRSARAIARALHMGRNTIQGYLAAFAADGLLEGAADELPAIEALRACVRAHVPQPPLPQQTSSLERWIEKIRELGAGAGPTAIHDYLRVNEPEYAGSLSAMKRLCQRLKRERGPVPTDVAIPVVTAPGEVAQVDFGYAGKRYDPARGILRKSWLFVMTLGFSRRSFCELVFDQKVETWIRLHILAFEHFGGVPRVVVPDNLKAAVVRAAFGVDDDAAIQRSYRELARHYGFQIDPTPPRSPKKKGKVERDVRYVRGSFLSTWMSVDIHEDRRALARWLAEVADRRVHGTTKRPPIELFLEEERQALLALPSRRFELIAWKQARLHTDSHVQVDGAFYSAPWRFLHEELWVRCTAHAVEIYNQKDEHLWTHARAARGKRKTVQEHLPEYRRDLRHRSREHWMGRAKALGADVERLVEAIFGTDDVLLTLRRVQAVVTHLEGFPRARANAAAKRAMHFGCTDYRSIKNILRQGLDLVPLPDERKRTWSTGSRFARKPTESLFAHKEQLHVHHG